LTHGRCNNVVRCSTYNDEDEDIENKAYVCTLRDCFMHEYLSSWFQSFNVFGIKLSLKISVRAFGIWNWWSCHLRCFETAYLSLVRPILEYAGTVWDPNCLHLENDLERVQKRAGRFAMNNYSFEEGSMTSIMCQVSEIYSKRSDLISSAKVEVGSLALVDFCRIFGSNWFQSFNVFGIQLS
jgi:hypothetical protein